MIRWFGVGDGRHFSDSHAAALVPRGGARRRVVEKMGAIQQGNSFAEAAIPHTSTRGQSAHLV